MNFPNRTFKQYQHGKTTFNTKFALVIILKLLTVLTNNLQNRYLF